MADLAEGDLAVIRADAGFAIVLPDRSRLSLNGQMVRILRIERYAMMGERNASVIFRPEPWQFAESAWPNCWAASPKYFFRIDDPRGVVDG
jgi:hypothetical protein